MLTAVLYAGELRDPFVFGPRSGTEAPTPSAGYILVGIFWDAAHPLAIVGDQTVGVGDVISDWRVVKIEQNGIELQRGDRREFLAPGSSIPLD